MDNFIDGVGEIKLTVLDSETFAQKPSSKKAIKPPTSQSESQSITSY